MRADDMFNDWWKLDHPALYFANPDFAQGGHHAGVVAGPAVVRARGQWLSRVKVFQLLLQIVEDFVIGGREAWMSGDWNASLKGQIYERNEQKMNEISF